MSDETMAMNGREPKRLCVELDPLPTDRIKWIHQDGAVELLPPENPDEIFARKVDNLRAQEAKEKAEAEAKEKSMRAGDSFLWKDGVDAVRGATHHAQQLSNFLGLLSKKVLALSSIAPSNSAGYAHSEFIAIEAKLLSLSRACTSIMEARDRLVLERKVDAKFGENLMALCTNWNVRPILKSTSSVPQAGPLGSLAVSLSLHMSESPDLEYMLLLRCQDGSLQVKQPPAFKVTRLRCKVKQPPAFKVKRLRCKVDPLQVPGNCDSQAFLPSTDVAFEALSPPGACLDSYLFSILCAQLDKDVFKTMTAEVCGLSTALSRSSAVHVTSSALTAGPVVVQMLVTPPRETEDGSDKIFGDCDSTVKMEVDAHQSAVVESGKREGAGRRDASTERERVEGRILTIVARQVQRVLQKQRSKPKPPSGGHVPRKPLQERPLALKGIVVALDSMSRHARFRAAIAETLEGCARLPVTGRSLAVSLHHCRSETVNVSGMLLHLTSPLAADDGDRQARVVIDVRMRDVVAYVTVSPAVVGCARGSDTCVTSQVATVQLQVLSAMAMLFMQGLQTEAKRLGCATALAFGLVPDEREGHGGAERDDVAVEVELRLWRPRVSGQAGGCAEADSGDAGGACKVLTLVCGRVETLLVEAFDEEGALVSASAWGDVRGRHWWDRIRRLILLW